MVYANHTTNQRARVPQLDCQVTRYDVIPHHTAASVMSIQSDTVSHQQFEFRILNYRTIYIEESL